eukprot:Nitzschia sp. Nitz4//scaffold5_size260463//134774//137477//NITZ4_000986-RA/size260463-augustus-gene-0.10-mRNA-1//1//CDS//3329555352//5507//frame0
MARLDDYSIQEEKKDDNPTPMEIPSVDKPLAAQPNVSKTPSRHSPRTWAQLMITFGTHLVVALLFVFLAASYCLQSFHDDYFVPMVQRARRTDEDLLEEFTYYERPCSVVDVTAEKKDASHLYIGPDSKNHGVDQMMTHGAVLFPNLLSPETVTELRRFVDNKNRVVEGTAAQYPMSQDFQRVSFGIEATEHPAVIQALKEINGNVQLKALLEGLIGENPALTELTAITSAYGAHHQEWHPDVKPDGNGVMFGRTYSHSYSLFMPLQNTTGPMGATDLCPGTHYCGQMDLYEMCESVKIGMHEVSGDGHWPAGSAALLNQQVWHRGTKHTDPNALDRIVFIVSFLARPNDTRQLSRGTYFHLKWNMWGNTWKDLADAAKFMSWPWNILTCMHVWRPAIQGWGYDLVTSAAMRIANAQNGCEPADVIRFVAALGEFGFPEFLDGPIDLEDDYSWENYIRETIRNILEFSLYVNVAVLALFFVSTFLESLRASRYSVARSFWNGSKVLLLTHGIIILVATGVVTFVSHTPWAQSITSGRHLMRPFPPVSKTWSTDPSVSSGPVTVVNRQDILIGARLDATTIGAYNRWLEFHPGNSEFLDNVEWFGGASFRSYNKGMSSSFLRSLSEKATESIFAKGGRLLQQDYRTGNWLEMTPEEASDATQQALLVGCDGPMYDLKRSLDFMVGEMRFGFYRLRPMSRVLLTQLRDLEIQLFHRGTVPAKKKPTKARAGKRANLFSLGVAPQVGSTGWKTRHSSIPSGQDDFVVGQEVVYFHTFDDSPGTDVFQATVLSVDNEMVQLAMYGYDGEIFPPVMTVPKHSVAKSIPPTVGSTVLANYRHQGSWMEGKVLSLMPNGLATIRYNNRRTEYEVPREHYLLW